ncbi:MAG: hypothetical protein HY692_08065, partial [Cyanobacteria bacterium NC_groundwater_1444_Ag_S-0.65um_54_12]|nr:hypothetical protein [Cyanobacteria bacterium NC_groundwater_1444_Ag_S-0.65um_54_12]
AAGVDAGFAAVSLDQRIANQTRQRQKPINSEDRVEELTTGALILKTILEIPDRLRKIGTGLTAVSRMASATERAVPGLFSITAHQLSDLSLGKLSIALGLLQTGVGIRDWATDERQRGKQDTAVGILTVGAGLAKIAGYAAIAEPISGAAFLISGGMQLATGAQSGDVKQTLLGLTKCLAGTLLVLVPFVSLTSAMALAAWGSVFILGSLLFEAGDLIMKLQQGITNLKPQKGKTLNKGR